MVQPFFVLTQGRTQIAGALSQSAGSAPAPYASSESDARARSAIGRLSLQLKKRLSDTTRLEVRGNVGVLTSDSQTLLDEVGDPAATPVLVQDATTSIEDHSWSFNGKLSHLLADRHRLVAGLEAEGVDRSENALTQINGAPSIPGFGGDIAASTRRLAAYAQDEWDPSPDWSAYAGLRWEELLTRSQAIAAPVGNTGVVLSPLLHAVWRLDPPARDQVRVSLTRSYRAPSLTNLVGVARLSTLYPAPGPNAASGPDQAGNPGLRPELARGVDVAVEHYLPSGGVVTVSLFRRNVEGLMRTVTDLETVPWATSQRWVSRPQNIGDATTQGIEFDARFRLDEVIRDALPLTARSNLSVYGSRVSGIQRPNNRIDQQPRASANLGGEYRLRGAPVTVGGNLNWIPPYTVQESPLQSQSYAITRVADAFVLWSVSPRTRLRLNLSNVLARNSVNANTILASGQAQTVVSNGPTYRVVALRVEVKL